MPGQPKYCEECKGYGNLYEQKTVRYGDKRIKENTPVEAKECVPCKGTGMITLQTEKVSVFDVQDQEKPVAHVETDEEYAKRVAEDPGADVDVPSEAPEPTEEELEKAAEEVEKAAEEVVEKIDDVVEAIKGLEKDASAEEEDEEVVFEPKHVEMEEGDMPL